MITVGSLCTLFLFPEFESVHLFPRYENKLIYNVLADNLLQSLVLQSFVRQ